MKIAVDAMGGDLGPSVNVRGAVSACNKYNINIILVGDETILRQELIKSHIHNKNLIEIRHASQVVTMDESLSFALRRKRDSSIWISAELIKDGEADALVSAGNTGAVMAIAKYNIGMLPEVDRPALAVLLPTVKGNTILIDVGANVDCKPKHLYQFALMGHFYARDILRKENPRVGLLSTGEEEGKGNEVTREAFKLIEASLLNFIGNVEGRDIFNGNSDVVVCDGFIGNVALKISESLAEMLSQLLKEELSRSYLLKTVVWLLKPAFRQFKKRIDYAEYGGALLLGLNGVCIISHGKSSPKAIENAIRVSFESVKSGVNEHIKNALQMECNLKSKEREMIQ